MFLFFDILRHINPCYTVINKEDNDVLLSLLADPGTASTRDRHCDGLNVWCRGGREGGAKPTTAKERGFLYLFLSHA